MFHTSLVRFHTFTFFGRCFRHWCMNFIPNSMKNTNVWQTVGYEKSCCMNHPLSMNFQQVWKSNFVWIILASMKLKMYEYWRYDDTISMNLQFGVNFILWEYEVCGQTKKIHTSVGWHHTDIAWRMIPAWQFSCRQHMTSVQMMRVENFIVYHYTSPPLTFSPSCMWQKHDSNPKSGR